MTDLDQYFKVHITADKMRATISMVQELPEETELTLDTIKEFSKKHGIVYGIDQDIVSKLRETGEAVLAAGKPPVRGENAYLRPAASEPSVRPTDYDTINNVDFKVVIEIVSVRKGDLVGKKVHATQGTAGLNVLGLEVPAMPGKDLKVRVGKNTEFKNDCLYALTDGQLSVERSTIHVLPTYEVNEDISLKTGNIDFVGNVVIRGSIPPGFEIKAGGDIHVSGTVEAATLKAGGSINLEAGIVGQNKSLIEAKGDLKTTFINQGNVHVGGNMEVGQTIFHSTCSSGGHIICNAGKGLIVGGSISAAQSIQANEIGNDMQTNTLLFIGAADKDIQKKTQMEKDLKKSKDEFMKLAKLLRVYIEKEKNEVLTARELAVMRKIQLSFQQTRVTIDELTEQLELVDDQPESNQGFIKTEQTIYPNVEVHFGKYRRKITSPHRNSLISLIDSEVVITVN